jgi:hypothetical protein
MAKTKNIGFKFTAIDKTKAAFNTIQSSLSKVGSAAKTVGKGLLGITAAATAAAAAFGALVLKQSEAIDKIGKVSSVTGVSTDLLQKFGFAAEQAGVTVKNAQLGLRRFSRRVGEVANGTGELKRALDALGISVFNVDGTVKSTEQVLFEFADGIAATENASEKLAFAFKGFDAEGSELVNTLHKGSAGLKEMFDQAERLGFVLDAEAIKNTEIFRDRLNELSRAVDGFSRRVVSELTPALSGMITDMTTAMIEFAEEAGGFDKLGQQFARGIIDAFIVVIKVLKEAGAAISHLLELTGFESDAMKSLNDQLSAARENRRGLARDSFNNAEAIAEETKNITKLEAELAKLKSGGANSFDKIITSLETFKAKIGETTPLIDGMVGGTGTGVEELEDNIGSVLGSIRTAVKVTTTSLQGAFTEFFNITSEKFMDFKNLVSSILKTIISEMTKAFIQNKFMKWLGGTSFGSFLGLEGKATGGTVTAGRPYLVGEKGAELFVPNQTGTIVPNNKMTGGGTTVNVAFNITAWDSKDATQAIAEQAPNIVSIVENSFRRRGQILGAT